MKCTYTAKKVGRNVSNCTYDLYV